ncbi:hypothetical protein E2562_032868 [Oryza meyeriana var. granulata]|uniref:Uncharacterized protein n=1 Tax=Oryza meyeriana var. granulata TaxID=110450 RepID=A0A6G1BPV8_9ORYZ|nr:hypothetical protein E2562_032868 [Oryza meyeriana var. granulata]
MKVRVAPRRRCHPELHEGSISLTDDDGGAQQSQCLLELHVGGRGRTGVGPPQPMKYALLHGANAIRSSVEWPEAGLMIDPLGW